MKICNAFHKIAKLYEEDWCKNRSAEGPPESCRNWKSPNGDSYDVTESKLTFAMKMTLKSSILDT